MRPTLRYIEEKFSYFNQLCFEGALPMPPIKLTMRRLEMGLTRCKKTKAADGRWHYYDFSIEISVRDDLPEEEYIDTLVHEMIHYYLAYNDITDDAPHGTAFREKMQWITNTFGIRVTIEFTPDEELLVSQRSHYRCVCVIEFCDGTVGVAVVAKNKLFQLWDQFLQLPNAKATHWYVSDRRIFDMFPVSVSVGCSIVDAGKIHHYLTGAKPLQNDGSTIKVKNDTL